MMEQSGQFIGLLISLSLPLFGKMVSGWELSMKKKVILQHSLLYNGGSC
jgi:hypothetical protein